MFNLVVTAAFEHNGVAYVRGMQITDPALVAELQEKHPHSVNRVVKPHDPQ